MQTNGNSSTEGAVELASVNLYEALGLPKSLSTYDEYIFVLLFVSLFIIRKLLTGRAFTPNLDGTEKFVERIASGVLPKGVVLDRRLKPVLVAGLYYSAWAIILMGGFLLLSDPSKTGHSYVLSFSASLAQDIFFFGIVGIALTYITLRNPSSAHPEERIGYLLNSPKAGNTVRKAIFDSISPNLIYCKKLYVKVNFVDYCDKLNAVRVEVLSTSRFFNTINDQAIEDNRNLFILETDKLKVDPSHGEFASNGAITSLKFRFDENDQYRDEIVSDIKVDKKHEHAVKILCEGGGTYESIYTYWVWHLIGKEHFWKTKRFVDEFVLQIKNETNYDIRFKCLIDDGSMNHKKQPCEEILTSNARKEYTFREMKPNRHRLFKLLAVERKK